MGTVTLTIDFSKCYLSVVNLEESIIRFFQSQRSKKISKKQSVNSYDVNKLYFDLNNLIKFPKNQNSVPSKVTEFNKISETKYLTPNELNSLTKDLLKLSSKIQSFKKEE